LLDKLVSIKETLNLDPKLLGTILKFRMVEFPEFKQFCSESACKARIDVLEFYNLVLAIIVDPVEVFFG
jgi:hypothetical protein